MAGRERKTPKGRCEGFTLLEFGVAAIILGVVAAVLLDRLRYYQEAAEKAHMEYTVATLKSALRLHVSTLMVEGRMGECAKLARQNPVDWLQQKPADYSGEFDGAPPDSAPPGGWYYDRVQRELVYRVRLGRHFVPGKDGRRQVRFRVAVVYDEIQGGEGASGLLVSGVTLAAVEPYRWF